MAAYPTLPIGTTVPPPQFRVQHGGYVSSVITLLVLLTGIVGVLFDWSAEAVADKAGFTFGDSEVRTALERLRTKYSHPKYYTHLVHPGVDVVDGTEG